MTASCVCVWGGEWVGGRKRTLFKFQLLNAYFPAQFSISMREFRAGYISKRKTSLLCAGLKVMSYTS
jgi:hypothetical protein